MTRDEIAVAVREAVAAYRGPESTSPIAIGDGTRPVLDVEGFDSFAGLAATSQLAVRLGLSQIRDNMFLTPDGNQARRFGEVLDELLELSQIPKEC